MLKAQAPHALRALETYNSGLDDEGNETVELIAHSDSKLFKETGVDV
jgi:hypothetical protein